MLVAGGRPALAQVITEYPVPTAGSQPTGIAAGPDGALWFTEGNGSRIGRITTSGAMVEYPVPTSESWPTDIVAGPDGALWFTERIAARIGRITTSGTVTEYPLPTAASFPTAMVPGPDGALWFVETFANTIGRITTSGVITEFPLPARSDGTSNQPTGLAAGADGALWFTERIGNKIGRITTTGIITEFPLPVAAGEGRSPGRIVAGPDGALWFTEWNLNRFSAIGRITTSGDLTEFTLSLPYSGPGAITVGPDGALWFTEAVSKIGRITMSGAVTEFPLSSASAGPSNIVAGPDGALWFTELQEVGKIGRIGVPVSTTPLHAAILPSSRSVQVGKPATAFATILNDGAEASACGIAPVTPLPADFSFQTTDSSNALTGTTNTRVPIPAGGAQTFVVSFTANAPLAPVDAVLGFACANVDAAVSVSGVNTLALAFSATPVPDVIVVGLTPSNDGYARTGGPSSTGLLVLATANVGTAGALTARVRLYDPAMPITATLCETDPMTGLCKAPPSASVTRTINANENATWSAFLQATGVIPADPARARAAFEFVDALGVVRGATSTAVTTSP